MTRMLARRHDPWGIDDDTMERLLGGTIAPADAPPGYGGVAGAFAALTAPPTHTETIDTSSRVAAIGAAVVASEPDARPARRRTPRRALTAVAAVVGVLSLTTGLAVAGALPDAAQRVASTVLAQVGVAAPSPGASSSPARGGSPSTGSGTPVVTAPANTGHGVGSSSAPAGVVSPGGGGTSGAPSGGGGQGTGGGGQGTGGGGQGNAGGGNGHGNGGGNGGGNGHAGGNGNAYGGGNGGGQGHTNGGGNGNGH
jgi:hypothetical protein